ncbi:hypothetical protein [Roseospira navarrensis]|uniref:Uncharacterized protein n=1 Tax=Roseospira navarrensis TaxID=140058 RepID=A0A7X1ZEK2_9PROT|nr:hypothetical protein [Roseospira navarrensis]MQX36852.1 hypothetical protein [Roseospira navarrensis]
MSRYPCHVEAALRVRVRRGHQGIWEAIRAVPRGQYWSIRQIWQDTGVPDQSTVREYVRRLCAAAYVDCQPGATPDRGRIYVLLRDAGPEAPRLRRDGSEVPPTGQEAMWRTLRMIGRDGVTADDLAVMASTDVRGIHRTTAACYLGHLCRAGYLRVVEEGRPGHRPGTGAPTRYALRSGMNTGPAAPMIARVSHAVWDPNRGEFMGEAEADVSPARAGGHG